MLTRILALLTLSVASTFAEGEPTRRSSAEQFDAQVARLVERGYPKLFGDRNIFDKEMSRLREEAVKYVPAKPGYTFLVVIPENDAPLPWQLKQITIQSRSSVETCNISNWRFVFRGLSEFRDTMPAPATREPYLIYDVDLGADTVTQWVCDTLAELPKTHRRGLTALECTALLVQHPEILSGAKIAAIGTEIADQDPAQTTKFACWYLYAGEPHYPIVDAVIWTSFNAHTKYNSYANFQFPTCKE